MPTAKADIPAEIRKNLMAAKKADRHNRESFRENIKFLSGEQWDPLEAQARRNKRLMLTADQLNAPVDQVVNGVRQNKPGPAVVASGSGADIDAADVFGGVLRRIDYENKAWIAIETAFESATGGNFGCWGVGLDYKNPRSFERVVTVEAIPNANETVYFDPNAIEKDRSDSMWAVQVVTMDLDVYRSRYPHSKAATRGAVKSIMDWFSEYRDPSLGGWVSENGIQVARYWKVNVETEMLRLYENGVAYWDSEPVPAGVKEDSRVNPRQVEHRTIHWYITNGVEVLQDDEWPGEWIPLFPVYGRERWRENKRYLYSMIDLAKEAQQAFNFAFTGACEVLASTTKAPWIGLLGQFKSKYNQWKTANTEIHAFLEYDEVQLAGGQTHVAPPQRTLGEPPIQAFLAFCQLCINAIQRATSVFDPSLGKQKSDQSGVAIQELQQQSSEGNYHWSDNLTITLNHYYRAVADLVQKEYDAPQVIEILRVDGKSESVWINKEFESSPGVTKHHRIATGMYAFTVETGPNSPSQRQANAAKITALIKVLPPELVAQAADLFVSLQDVGPIGQTLADRLTPPQYRNQNDPRAAAAHLAQAMQQNQQLQQIVQKLQMVIQTKQPELEVRKYVAELSALAGIREAQIKAGDNIAERDASALESMMGLAHEAADAEMQRQHEAQLQRGQQAHDAALQGMQQGHEADQNQQQQDADAQLAQQQQPTGEE